MTGNIPAETPWEIMRLGKFTSSQIDSLFTEPRSKAAKEAGELSETAKTYIRQKAAEIITGTTRQVTNWALEWGNTYEPLAAQKLELRYPGMIYLGKQNPEFFKYTDLSGGSPDGYHPEQLLVFEIKCPEDPANHVEYCLISNGDDLKEIQREYYHQIQMNMACVALKLNVPFKNMKAVFASYCPIVNEPFEEIHVVVIEPDIEFYSKLPKVIGKAEQCLADLIYRLNKENKSLPQQKKEIVHDENSLVV